MFVRPSAVGDEVLNKKRKITNNPPTEGGGEEKRKTHRCNGHEPRASRAGRKPKVLREPAALNDAARERL